MIRSLATNPKLIGLWHWSGAVRAGNHEAIVPVDLFLEAYELATRRGKPRGKGIKFDPLEWNGLLYCCNHDPPVRISGNTAGNSYRCQTDYVQGRGSTCLDISARYIDEPLTTTVLGQLHFSPLTDEVLAQLEREATRVDLEAEQTNREIARLENRLENLKIISWLWRQRAGRCLLGTVYPAEEPPRRIEVKTCIPPGLQQS